MSGIFIYKDNQQLGEKTIDSIINGLESGEYKLDDLGYDNIQKDWKPLSKFFQQTKSSYEYIPVVTETIANQIPKCLSCGQITPWNIEPLFLPVHWIIAVIFLCAGGTGVIYLLVVWLIRKDPSNRTKICPKCGAKNLWTFIY